VHDASVTVAQLGISFFGCVPATEAGDAVVDDLRNRAQADSVLNHIIKNIMASVSVILEIELMTERLPEEASSTGLKTALTSHLQDGRDRLTAALSVIQRSMTWISSRQVLVALASKTYFTTMPPVDMSLFFKNVATREKFKFHDATRVLTHAAPNSRLQIAFDEKMARLALENGITNAVQHGDGGEIEIGAEYHEGKAVIVIRGRLQNFHPCEINGDVKLGAGDVGLIVLTLKNGLVLGSNVSSESLRALLNQRSYNQSPSPRINLKKSSLGTQAGLPHIVLACRAAQGSCDLSTSDDGKSVILTVSLPARLLATASTTTAAPQLLL
jgi:hypothetical protein